MTNRYDELGDRARWFLENFDELDLADLCASQETSNEKRQGAIDRVAHVIEAGAPWTANHGTLAARIREALTGASDDGPSVRECAEADRNYDVEQGGE